MFFIGIGANLLNWLIEYKFFLAWAFLSHTPTKRSDSLDRDVEKERERVISGRANNDIMRLEGLTKVSTPKKKIYCYVNILKFCSVM